MIPPHMLPLVGKYITRHRARTLLTLGGIATAMFLFCAVQAMRTGVAATTQETASETNLVVYRENRFCPFTSELPQDYTRTIASIPGVKSVAPMRIVVNNCRASLDVVEAWRSGVLEAPFESPLAEEAVGVCCRKVIMGRSEGGAPVGFQRACNALLL